MKFSSTVFVLALAAELVVASSWFGKPVYNKWHETELERWLSDHDIPHPKAADRKELENIVKENWQTKVSSPYADWDTGQLQQYLKEKGIEVQESAKQNRELLAGQVEQYWCEAGKQAVEAWGSVSDWIFDTYGVFLRTRVAVGRGGTNIYLTASWSDSQLRAFLDKHVISCPQPRNRNTLLNAVHQNYESVSKKAGETAAYPGDWLYETWSNSDLKAWLEERGYPVPQSSMRDRLIASVRRNARVASLRLRSAADHAYSSAEGLKENVADKIFDTWSDSQIKEWADKNGIKVPQGSKRNELLAIARKHRASLMGDNVSASVSSLIGAATSKAGNEYAKATDDAERMANDGFNEAVDLWTDTRLKAYLDSRGIPVPQGGRRDELLAKVRLQKHKAATGYSAWTFDTWTTENLKKWLASQGNKAANQAYLTREELLKHVQDSYASASSSGGSAYASLTSALASATVAAKDSMFETWSESDLKSYLDGYGVPVYQGSTANELRALARRQHDYFLYGANTPSGTMYAKLKDGMWRTLGQLGIVGTTKEQEEMQHRGEMAKDRMEEKATYTANRAREEAQRAKDQARQEL
ncbi:hypothetical protein GP486_008002 [Trichoglossum hirsutum]|uniref:Stress response protein ish1 n=1 Tax=Trichoglossum hirsutum TaxID=265104 RepID=A0A9P8IBS1_9PEZI|nr:hypothetical protein GP486_008002 [Trichoglossum hirsutum]